MEGNPIKTVESGFQGLLLEECGLDMFVLEGHPGAEAAGAQVGVEWVQEEDAQKEGDTGC